VFLHGSGDSGAGIRASLTQLGFTEVRGGWFVPLDALSACTRCLTGLSMPSRKVTAALHTRSLGFRPLSAYVKQKGPSLSHLGGRASSFPQALAQSGLQLVCPTAAARPYALCGGERMNVWHNRWDMTYEAPEDPAGVEDSYQQILEVIVGLMGQGVASNRIFVGGFSMGGGMALQFLARFRRPLAGVFALSSFLPRDSQAYAALVPGGASCPWPPILMCHGECGAAVVSPRDWPRDFPCSLGGWLPIGAAVR
jgi:hypothetical protein